jgi:hypothetical protein
MILHTHSDASYLSALKARSCAGGHFFLSQQPNNANKAPVGQPRLNGPIHTTCHILRDVMASAAKAKVGALFYNGQDALPLRMTLAELGHPQPPTPMQTDNSTAAGFADDTIKQKRSKAMDMRFYLIKDCIRQKQFLIYWQPGTQKLGDYHTRHHPPSHHRRIQSTFLLQAVIKQVNLLRGCVKPHTGLNPGPTGFTGLCTQTAQSTNNSTLTPTNKEHATKRTFHATKRALLNTSYRLSLI